MDHGRIAEWYKSNETELTENTGELIRRHRCNFCDKLAPIRFCRALNVPSMSKDKAANSRQPVRSATSTADESGVLDDGISGSAMAVPPPKVATSAVRPDNAVKAVKGRPRKSLLVSKSDTSNCNMKQTKEVIDRSQELVDTTVSYGVIFLHSSGAFDLWHFSPVYST